MGVNAFDAHGDTNGAANGLAVVANPNGLFGPLFDLELKDAVIIAERAAVVGFADLELSGHVRVLPLVSSARALL